MDSKTTIELLNDTNWDTWSFIMEQYLTVNDLWDIVNGDRTEPSETEKKADFLKKQKSARARIAIHVSTSQLAAVRTETDPKKIWDELRRLNRPRGFGTRMVLRRRLANMKWESHVPMATWIMSVRDVARQIKDLDGDVSEEDIIVILTKSLPESYTPLIVQLDNMEDKERTLSHVITRLIGEECRQSGEKPEEDTPIALAAARKPRRDRSEITCFGCGVKGHYRSECPGERDMRPAASGSYNRTPSSTVPSGTLF